MTQDRRPTSDLRNRCTAAPVCAGRNATRLIELFSWIYLALCLGTFPATAAAEGVSVQHIEVTQGIQDIDHTVPMIAGRRTFVRIFFTYNGSSVERNLRGTAELRRADGSTKSVDSITSYQSVFDPDFNAKLIEKRKVIEQSLLFELPGDWTIPGTISIRPDSVKRKDGAPVSCTNCSEFRTVMFGAAAPIRIQLIGLRYTRNGKTLEPRPIDYKAIFSWLRRTYPTADFEIRTRVVEWAAPAVFDDGTGACGEANAKMTELRKLDGANGRPFHYYGVVYDGGTEGLERSFMRGCASVPATLDPSAVGSGPAGTGGFPWDTSTSYAGWYAAHEIGHTFGRPHPHGCTDAGDDPNWPTDIPKNVLGTDTRPFVGFDPGDSELQIPMRILPWDKASDLMTYCPEEWLGAHNYIEICNRVAAENNMTCPKPTAPQEAGPVPSDTNLKVASGPGGINALRRNIIFITDPLGPSAAASSMSGAMLTVTGRVDLDLNTGKISSVNRIEDPPEASQQQGGQVSAETPRLRAYDRQGHLLAEVPAKVLLDTDQLPNGHQTAVVSGELPYSIDIQRIELVRKDVVLSQRIAAPEAPSVTRPTPSISSLNSLLSNHVSKFNFKVGANVAGSESQDFSRDNGALVYRWQSQQPASAKYTVQISTNGGKDWSTVAVETAQRSIVIDPSWIEGANSLEVRVRASDGIHETFSTSAPLDLKAPVQLPQQ